MVVFNPGMQTVFRKTIGKYVIICYDYIGVWKNVNNGKERIYQKWLIQTNGLCGNSSLVNFKLIAMHACDGEVALRFPGIF